MSTTIQDAILAGLLVIGLTGSDGVEVNAGSVKLNNSLTIQRDFVAGPGVTLPINLLMNATGDPSGMSDVRMQRQIVSAQGPYGFKDFRNRYAGVNHNGTGLMVRAYTDHNYISVTGGGILDVGRVNYSHFVVSNGSINDATVFEAGDLILSGNGMVTTSRGFRVDNIGHATNVKYAYGIQIANFNASSLVAAIDIATTAGPGKHGIRQTGDAVNVLGGKLKVGATGEPTATLDVAGDAKATVFLLPNGIGIYGCTGVPTFTAARGSLCLNDSGATYRHDGTGWVQL